MRHLKKCAVYVGLATFGLLSLMCPAARAEIAYIWPAGQAGNQNFAGSVGMTFVVNQPIQVTSLGVFDHLGDGISGTLTSKVWDVGTGTSLAEATFTNADPGTLIGSARLKTIPTITLSPGSYRIASSGHSAIDLLYNPATNTTTDDGAGSISFTGGRAFNATPGDFPNGDDAGGFYGGGTFEFISNPLPPATFNGDVIAYESGAPGSGTQNFNGSAGMDFVVNEPIFVSALGAFDTGQDGLNRPITVEIYARNDNGTPEDFADDTGGAILASHVLSGSADALVGGSRFASIGNVRLEPGAYTINAHGYGEGELFANAADAIAKRINDGGGALSFVGRSRFCFDGGDCTSYPLTADAGPANRYAAGTFAFTPVPEPSTWALAACGFAAACFCRRRRR